MRAVAFHSRRKITVSFPINPTPGCLDDGAAPKIAGGAGYLCVHEITGFRLPWHSRILACTNLKIPVARAFVNESRG